MELDVVKAIKKFSPDEVIDQTSGDLAVTTAKAYLEANGYQQDDIMPKDNGECVAYFVYDVLKWAFENV